MVRKKKWLSYKETLRRVEDFMIKSGFRKYCSEVCVGSCCGGCYTKSEKACHRNEGRRLSCSTYFCGGTGVISSGELSEEIMYPYRKAERHIIDQIHNAWISIGKGINKPGMMYVPTPNSYFEVHTKEMMEAFKAERKIVTAGLNAEAAKKIRFYMDMVIKGAEIILAKKANKKKERIWGKRITRFRLHKDENGAYYLEDSTKKIVYIN